MEPSLKLLSVVLPVLILTGCASMKVERYYNDGRFAPKSPQEVQIYRNDPPRAYVVLGTAFNAVVEGVFSDDSDRLRQEAAAMGADAIVENNRQYNCREVVVDPEKTTVKAKSEDEIRSVSKPAEYETTCDTSYEYKFVRFTD
jgi:hypothetical protein